ncbi:MAG TPA: RDD family protein [Vicinamibacterales bacterium]|nr:RDD family protein [Vicinamibacterales bacterium]
MKCPKCHYLSFEPEPRCRHCGYDFSLAEPDLAIKPAADDDGPLSDFRLHDDDARSAPVTLGPIRPASSARKRPAASALALTLEKPEPAPDFRPEPPRPRLAHPPAPTTTELPLFVKGLAETGADEASPAEAAPAPEPVAEPSLEPLVKMPPVARAPLAVRRRAPDSGRIQRTESAEAPVARKLGPFDHDLLEDLKRIEAKAAGRSGSIEPRSAGSPAAVRRVAAAGIDLALLASLCAVVVWFTLRQCELTFAQVGILPIVPMVGFLLLLVLGYLLLFTAASGQTIGKMALGLRVVNQPDDAVQSAAPTLQQAAYRSLLTLPSVLVLGLGFLPALVGAGRAFHDRLAGTRVVRA